MQGLKQCFGIDVAKDSFVVRFGLLQDTFDIKINKEKQGICWVSELH